MASKAIYPGTFDPITNGHLDIMRRACQLFGSLTVAVNQGSAKEITFPAQQRAELIRKALKSEGLTQRIQVDIFDGLLADYLKRKKTNTVVRGLRFISDFEYEFQLALTNRRLFKQMETIFLMPDEKHIYLSSSIVKEIARHARSPKDFVPTPVAQALKAKFK